MELGDEAAAAAAERLSFDGSDQRRWTIAPFSAAPAACGCARVVGPAGPRPFGGKQGHEAGELVIGQFMSAYHVIRRRRSFANTP